MTPEHFQLIISDLYEENYKSDFAKDLRENIDDLTDFDWIYRYSRSNSVGSDCSVGNGTMGCVVGSGTSISVGGHNSFVGSRIPGSLVGGDDGFS